MNNFRKDYEMLSEIWNKSTMKKDLGAFFKNNLKFPKQCCEAFNKTNNFLGLASENLVSKQKLLIMAYAHLWYACIYSMSCRSGRNTIEERHRKAIESSEKSSEICPCSNKYIV